MPILEEITASGTWLFRWRSYLPFLLLIFLPALEYHRYPLGNHRLSLVWELACLLISCTGLVIRFLTAGSTPRGTSGRNMKQQLAEVLNTTGMYSVVRHPLYQGNFVIGFGVSCFFYIWWVPLMYVALFVLYYERIAAAEEVFLREKFGQTYLDWALRTPTFVPDFRLWRKPLQPFSLRKAIRNEYPCLLGVAVAYFAADVVCDSYLARKLIVDPVWGWFAGVVLCLYLGIRFIHKRPRLLKSDREDIAPPSPGELPASHSASGDSGVRRPGY